MKEVEEMVEEKEIEEMYEMYKKDRLAKHLRWAMWAFFFISFVVILILYIISSITEAGELPTGTLTATPSEISLGEVTTLTLTTTNTTGISLTFFGDITSGKIGPHGGQLVVKPEETTTYKVNLKNPSGKITVSTTVTVIK